MKKIDGRALADNVLKELKRDIAARDVHPKLAVLLVGDDPASKLYVSLKQKAADEVGVDTEVKELGHATNARINEIIEEWNADPSVNGVLVQLPLPDGLDADAAIAAIDPKKDADGFHPDHVGVPPLHEGILRLIGATDVAPNGARAAIIANSDTFSKPLARILEKAGSTVTIMSADELDKEALAKAQIVVIAVGRAKFLKRGMVSPGVCIIDVGTNKSADGKVVGDVDAESLKDLDGWLSPVPGGVGPMTIAMLLKHVFELTK